MRSYTETRGKYKVTCYSVSINDAMKRDALDFARKIILSNNQYSRLLPAEIHGSSDVSAQQKIEIQRTYMGKLGELAFLKLLKKKGKIVNTTGMFEIYEGQENVDSFDFITPCDHSIDVKTGFRSIHTRLLVNTEQFDGDPKDFYVAVKIEANDVDPKKKLVDWDDISTARILGYADYKYMKHHAGIWDFGEGPARWLYYNRLMGIDRLIDLF